MTRPDLDDDLTRRLVDLADSAGPWDDPLPEVLRRAAELASAPASGPTESSTFRAPTAARARRGRLRSIDPTRWPAPPRSSRSWPGWVGCIHAGGPSSEKASSGGPAMASMAAGASGTGGGASADNRTTPQSAASAAGCAWPAPTSAVKLTAPANVRSGAAVSLGVRLTGSAAADVYSPLVVVLNKGQVVGRLVPTVIPPGPRLRPSSPTAASYPLTGTLRRSTCAQADRAGARSPRHRRAWLCHRGATSWSPWPPAAGAGWSALRSPSPSVERRSRHAWSTVFAPGRSGRSRRRHPCAGVGLYGGRAKSSSAGSSRPGE